VGCPSIAAPGELFPPSVWSVCPQLEPQSRGLWPFLPVPSALPNTWDISGIATQVPWVSGYRLDVAERFLARAGLPVGSVTGPSNGIVVSTNPPFGSAVEFGHPVDVLVAPSG
jgi:hypothetical protein